MRRWGTRWLVAIAGLVAACAGDEGETDTAAPGVVGPPPAGPQAECPLAGVEDCPRCYDNVGTCCYGFDEAWESMKGALAASCSSRSFCAACCAECAAMSCEELEKAGACPNLF